MSKMQLVGIFLSPLAIDGSIQSNPIIVPMNVTDNSIVATESSKEYDFLGQCCRKPVVFGAKEVSGSMSGPLTSGIAPIIIQHIFGAFESYELATTETWAASTVFAVGDMVNHSDGEHTLICKKSGESSTIEPTVQEVGKKIEDNKVLWIAQKTMRKSVVQNSKKPRGVAIEKKFEKEDGTFMYVRYMNVYFSKTSIQSQGSEADMTWSVDAVGARVEDSTESDFVALEDMAGAKKLYVYNDFFMNDENASGYCAYRDEIPIEEHETLSFDLERTVEKSTAVAKKVGNRYIAYPPNVSRTIKSKGSFTIFATEKDYESFKHHDTFDAKIEMKNDMGASVVTSFLGVTPKYSDISLENCIDSKLTSELFVTGDCAEQAPVQCEVVYPSMTDTEGNSVTYPV